MVIPRVLQQNLWQIGQGVPDLLSDIQTDRDYYYIYIYYLLW